MPAAMLAFVIFTAAGCRNASSQPPAPPPMRVKTETINLEPVPRVDEYVATVKSRRSASIQPQVDGALTRIVVKSGDHVNAGQALMTVDPLKQQSVVEQQRSTEAQKKALAAWYRTEYLGLLKKQQALYTSQQPLPIDPKLLDLRALAAKAELPVPIDAKLLQLRADVEASTKQLANKRLTGVQDLTWALVNNPAFLFNR